MSNAPNLSHSSETAQASPEARKSKKMRIFQAFRHETTRFLAISLTLVVILTICVFSFLAIYINHTSTNTIREVGRMYMSGMCEQIAMHFETTITLRLKQLDALVNTTFSENSDPESVQESSTSLIQNVQALDFNHLAFYNSDGSFTMLYGPQIQVTDPEPFQDSLTSSEEKIAVGSDMNGNRLILFGIPLSHTEPESGSETPVHSIALVATLPASYISETLSLEENSDHVYSFIIRKDGSFVIRTSDAFRQNYFDRVRNLYESVDGQDPELYIEALSDAMEQNQEYTAEFVIYGASRQIYCTKLSHSEWFLLTCMPYKELDHMLNGLTSRWSIVTITVCALVLIVLLLIFWQYFKLLRLQMQELEYAREAALHASKAKSEFLSNMSHDIRTPMNAIVGMTAIAIANSDDQERVKNCLKKISLSGRHLLGLINDVLDMSKIESGKLTLNMDQVSLREVMDSIVSIVQPQVRSKNQSFDVSIHDISAENVCCDSIRLNQILLNILGNAVKFTPDNGSIRISMYEEPSEKGEDWIRIHFRIQDTGIGISPEYKEKIFESFTREDNARVHKTEGTGLGMAITKYIVDAMGGTIEVESELGKGSEFHVILDLEKAEVQEVDMILPPWRMLVVDDDRMLCESTVSSLKSIGVNADWTLDAETAINMVVSHNQQHDPYQIILLDWKLPGMDGISAARIIRERCSKDVPILLISAYDWSEIEAEAKAAGITGFISKPLFRSTLFYGLRPFAGLDDHAEDAETDKSTLIGKNILLAEDNELNWEIADELLSDLGLKLDWAENGQICVEKFQNSEIGAYDAILMDLRMPVMTGYEATRAIRNLDRPDSGLPIIAMTADAFSDDIQRCLECGMNAHVAKPIDVQEIVHLLEKFITEYSQSS